jgi:hypothetical protein
VPEVRRDAQATVSQTVSGQTEGRESTARAQQRHGLQALPHARLSAQGTRLSVGYVREKCWQAVHSLDGDQRLSLRLVLAGQYLARLRPEDFEQEESRLAWSSIMDGLRGLELAHPHGSFAATVSEMSQSQLRALEHQIRDLYESVGPLLSDD